MDRKSGNIRIIIAAVMIGTFLLAPLPVRADTVTDISTQLICQCGCTSVLNNCTHIECHSREAMTNLIKQRLDQGQSTAQIIPLFVAQYGEQVLASPPKKGFNLTAWITPFVAILAGGALIYLALKKWVKQGSQPQAILVAETDEEKEKYQRRLEQELEEFSERGFR